MKILRFGLKVTQTGRWQRSTAPFRSIFIEFQRVNVATARVALTNALTSADRGRLAGKKKPKESSIAGRIGRARMSSLEAAAKVNGSTTASPSPWATH